MDLVELSDYLKASYSGSHWEKVGVKRRAGILLPLFSIRTEKNMGTGEYPDLEPLSDWCRMTGHSVIQLLPINDTGVDNFPYSALSAFALNPVFLAPGRMDGGGGHVTRQDRIPARENRLNYHKIFSKKMCMFEGLFASFQKKGSPFLKEEFQKFIRENRSWLSDYAEFMALKEIHRWRPWEEWRSKYSNRNKRALKMFREFHSKRVDFFSYLQWQAHKQLLAAHKYALGKGVLIKGDIPYLVGRDSADVWANREYFNMDISAGAPPDMFSKKGQKWGFPTYNWDAIKSRGYEWYRSRLKKAEKYFDLYRIDHAVGIYRIFSIEKDRSDGSVGVFDPEESVCWEEHGETLIRMMLDSTTMLPVAEDLGVVPDCVRPNLRKLGVPRTIVERWERDYDRDGGFVKLTDVEPVAMNTMSTHDTETIRQWWRDNGDERADFSAHMRLHGLPPKNLTPEIHQQIMERSLNSSCLFTINLPQDIFNLKVFSDDPDIHRINIPARVSAKNWSYIFPLSMEDLLNPPSREIEEENIRIRELNERSDRC